MAFKRTTQAPNGRELLIQGNVNIDRNLVVEQNGTIGVDLIVGQDALIGRNLTVTLKTLTDQLEVTTETELNTLTNVNGNFNVVGNTTMRDNQLIEGTTAINGNTTITAEPNVSLTTVEGDLLITGNGFQQIGQNNSSIDIIVTDRLAVLEETVLSTTTFINGNLFVNGVFVQTIGNAANLIEDIFSNSIQTEYILVNQAATIARDLTVDGNGIQTFGTANARMETYYGNDMIVANLTVDNLALIEDISANNIVTNTLVVNQETTLNNNTFINGNLFVNGVQTQNLGNANNLIENAFFANIDTETLTVTQAGTFTNDVTIQGLNGTQLIGTADGSRVNEVWATNTNTRDLTTVDTAVLNNDVTITGDGVTRVGTTSTERIDEIWGDFTNVNQLEVEASTELNGPVNVVGDGLQTFGQNNGTNRIDEYYGIDLNLSGDLFMLDENKKDFLDLDVQYVIYVKANGDDARSGNNLSNSVRTIRRGLELAKKFRENNDIGQLDENTTTVLVSVYPGIYVEEGELVVPENAAVVSSGGQYVTEIHMSDAGKRNFRNMFLLNSGSYAQGFTFRNMELDDFDDPTGGFAYAFAPGATIVRSPYVRDSSQVSNYNPSAVAAPLDPANANPAVGKGAGMILADRRILNPNTIWPYILAFGATPRSPNGIGYCARNGAGINGISSLGIFQRSCFYALDGGQITLNNSGTQFGDLSMHAKGFINVVEEKTTTAEIVSNPRLAANIIAESNVLVNAMWDDLVANVGNVVGPDGNVSTSWNQSFVYDEALCERDVGYIIDAVTYDLALDTTYNSVIAAEAYKRAVSAKVVNDQMVQTILAVEYVRDYIIGDTTTTDDLADDEDNDLLESTKSGLVSNALPESGLNLTNYSRRALREKFEIILDVLRVSTSAAIVFNDPITASQEEIDAKALLQLNRTLIQTDIVDYIDLNYPSLQYDANLCFRDVGYIVDAITHDILYDGNFASRIVADSYFSQSVAIIPGNESNATIDAYNQLQTIASNVVLGTYAGQLTLESGNIATTDEANSAVDLIQITVDVLEAGNITSIPVLVGPDINAANANVQGDYTTTVNNKAVIQSATTSFLDVEYGTYYEDLVKRDATNLLESLSYDLGSGTQMVTQTFSLGLFGYNAQKVYPIEQEPAFIYTWEFLKEALIPVLEGNSSLEYAMVSGLMDEVLISTVQDPTVIQFSSLIESLAHQFNNAGAGVNRNALPLNFNKPGFNRPVPFSVLQEDGGRVRWSGADELNNQYFAGGTRINGVTGKFEGRPFNISVRQIARRIANSRGFF